MNPWLVGAAGLMTLTALVHSVLGEHLIFRRLRGAGWVPSEGGSLLLERHVRILWASWHVLSVLGLCLAAVLAQVASGPMAAAPDGLASALAPESGAYALARTLVQWISASCLLASALVLIGTRGRHPGWLSLLLVAVLCLLGLR
jgi:hypothetical protein